MTCKAYDFCLASIDAETTPKYVKRQMREFMDVYEGKSDKYIFSEKKYKQLVSILKLLIMPKGLKAGKTLY